MPVQFVAGVQLMVVAEVVLLVTVCMAFTDSSLLKMATVKRFTVFSSFCVGNALPVALVLTPLPVRRSSSCAVFPCGMGSVIPFSSLPHPASVKVAAASMLHK